MKTTCSFALAILSLCSGAIAATGGATVHLNMEQEKQPIGIEPEGGAFRPVIETGAASGTLTLPGNARATANGTVAIYATAAGGIRNERPLARLAIAGRPAGESVRLTFTREGSQLTVTAADAQHPARTFSVTELSKADTRNAALAAVKTRRNALPAIAEGPASGNASGKGLHTTLGLRSGSGTMHPFLRAGDPVGSTATVNLRPAVPGQTTADITVYAGENQYLENDRPYARYLISGLSQKSQARFALRFTVDASGAVSTPEVTDSVTKQPLEVRRYSGRQALKMQEAASPSAPPAVGELRAAF